MLTELETASEPPAEAWPPKLLGRSGLDNLPPRCRPSLLLLLAADDRRGLLEQLASVRERITLRTAGALELPPPPEGGEHRLAILAGDAADLAARIATAEAKLADAGSRRLALKGSIYYASGPPAPGKTAFLFPGQGSQHPRMLDELCLLFPEVRAWFETLDGALAGLPLLLPSLLAFPPADGLTDEERALLDRELYDLRGGAQLGVIVNLALYDLVVDLGVPCDMMVGHSNGEHAALWASQTFRFPRSDLVTALRLMAEQAISMPMPPEPEGVLTVGLRDRALLDQVLAEEKGALYLSMVNCPSQFVLAGLADAVDRAAVRLGRAGGLVVRVPLHRAYHTPLFEGWGRWLLSLYVQRDMGPGRVPLYSCASAAPFPDQADLIRRLATEQWSRPLDFEKTVHRLYDDGARLFVEIGPDNKLKGFVGDILRGREHLAVSTSSARSAPVEQLHRLVGELFVHGVELDFTSRTWGTLRPGVPGQDVSVNPSPTAEIVQAHFLLMQEFLASQARVLAMVSAAPEASSIPAVTEWPLLGDDVVCDGRRLETERRFDLERDPLLRDHSLGPAVAGRCPGPPGPPALAVLPFTFSMEVVAEAASRLFGGRLAVVGMSGLRGTRWLALDRGALTVRITAEVHEASPRLARVRLFQVEEGRVALAFEADVEVAAAPLSQPAPPPPRAAAPGLAPPRLWSAADFYDDYAFHGPAFRALREVRGVGGEAVEAALVVPERPVPRGAAGPPALLLDPALLDCAGQLVGFWLLEGARRDFGIFPFQLRDFRVFQPAPAPGEAIGARAAVRWHAHGATDADVDFCDAQGRLIYRFTGFEQRYLAFPPRFARALLGSRVRPRYLSDPVDVEDGRLAARAIDGLPQGFLEESWGIWSRALAHQTLTREELDEWYEERRRSVPWLLGRAAAKETVRVWAAAAHRLELAACDLTLTGGEQGLLEVRCPELAARGPVPRVRIETAGESIVAHVLDFGPSTPTLR
ncbi:MAG TPA: polyketide synthase dehydratase domain-containing protein [Thermoanaerobaculia bacterium]|nr:polyketide synthase dehydratase domain-containing protein [Thermoanaerobaculia bacterium]